MNNILALYLLLLCTAVTIVLSKTEKTDQRQCNSGWTLMPESRKCFKIFSADEMFLSDQNTWLNSLKYCSRFGGQLAIIDSYDAQLFLSKLFESVPNNKNKARFGWIGLTRLTKFTNGSTYKWTMNQETQDNYAIGFYKPAGLKHTAKFSPNTTSHLKWAVSEPSYDVDKCAALASNVALPRSKTSAIPGKVVDLPCDNRPNMNARPRHVRTDFAICEVRATDDTSAAKNHNIDLPAGLSFDAIHVPSTKSPCAPTGYWENGNVFYEISPDFSTTERKLLLSYFKNIEFNSDSCVSFVERKNDEPDYVYFKAIPNSVCASTSVGRKGGKQEVLLGSVCFDIDQPAHILHELLHVLGVPHEHQRWDRDKYVRVDFLSLQAAPNVQEQFVIIDNPNLEAWLNLPYDFESVMHYAFNAWALTPHLSTIEPKSSENYGFLRVVKRQLSWTDKLKLQQMYCKQKPEDSITQTTTASSARRKESRGQTSLKPNANKTKAHRDSCAEEEANDGCKMLPNKNIAIGIDHGFVRNVSSTKECCRICRMVGQSGCKAFVWNVDGQSAGDQYQTCWLKRYVESLSVDLRKDSVAGYSCASPEQNVNEGESPRDSRAEEEAADNSCKMMPNKNLAPGRDHGFVRNVSSAKGCCQICRMVGPSGCQAFVWNVDGQSAGEQQTCWLKRDVEPLTDDARVGSVVGFV